jgi:hypothetical protein
MGKLAHSGWRNDARADFINLIADLKSPSVFLEAPIDVCQIVANHLARLIFPNFTTQHTIPLFKGQ